MIFIANPNNPTGTFADGDALQKFLRALPGTSWWFWTRLITSTCRRRAATTAWHGWVNSEPDHLANFFQGVRSGIIAGGLCLGRSAGDGHAQPRAPAFQRQQRGASRGGGGALQIRNSSSQRPLRLICAA